FYKKIRCSLLTGCQGCAVGFRVAVDGFVQSKFNPSPKKFGSCQRQVEMSGSMQSRSVPTASAY
ncbi:MAG: hypothetical protein V3V86_04235, partial [Gammaproteobacteria bacterium]